MPCYDSRDRETGVSQAAYDYVSNKLDKVTSYLCEITANMKLSDISNPEIREWVKEHRRFDELKKIAKTKQHKL